jgi:hypothetical protein
MINKTKWLWLVGLSMYAIFAIADNQLDEEKTAINRTIDGLHSAASKADLSGYLGAFTTDGVFMGTDDWERWSRPTTLDNYVTERFQGGVGWTYTPEVRNITMGANHQTAWFDEITVSEKWGRFRGTGVVVKQGDTWKIAHYSMSVLVANEAFFDVADLNNAAFAARHYQK